MNFIKSISPYFKLTKNEKRGFLAVVVLLLVVVILKIILPYLIAPGEFTDIKIAYEIFESRKSYTKKPIQIPDVERNFKQVNKQERKIIAREFDPNSSSVKDLIGLGFSHRIARNIISYRSKGGIFANKSELFKIYGVDSSHADLINNYCNIDTINLIRQYKQRENFNKVFTVDINSADSAKLKQLPGIGKVLSGRLCNYRERVGGFTNIEQLKDVYGVNDETIAKLKDYVIIDTGKVIKLNINTLTEKELQMHPYLTTYQSRAIIKYRDLIGNFKSKNQLVENYILGPEEYAKIEAYVVVK